jgi:hypothetical protein
MQAVTVKVVIRILWDMGQDLLRFRFEIKTIDATGSNTGNCFATLMPNFTPCWNTNAVGVAQLKAVEQVRILH